MATKTSDAERRSRVAETCVDFGGDLLRLRLSSMTPDDAQQAVQDLFSWFEEHDAFTEGNVGIAVHAIAFGRQLLDSRKTATLEEAVEAIQNLYSGLAQS